MKALLIKIQFVFSIMLITCFSLQGQSIFFNTACSTEFPVGVFCVDGNTSTSINVSGLSTLGADNFGLVEVFIDFNTTGSFFNSHLELEAPNGQVFTMASTNNSSFPNWGGGSVGVSFVPCIDYDATTQAGADINFNTYRPIDDYLVLNDNMINPNGEWKINACVPISNDVPFNIFCARLTFDNICTEAENVVVNNPECAGEEYEVTFDVNPGVCPGIWASVDDINYEEFNNLEANQLSSSDASVTTLFVSDSQPGSGGGSSCDPHETPINVAPSDSEPPTFDCPVNQDVVTDANCEGMITITDPIINDNCPGADGYAVYNVTGSATISSDLFDLIYGALYAIAEGSSFDYNVSGTGTIVIDWVVNDAAGNSTTCQQIIEMIDDTPPVWTNSQVLVNAECGVDNIEEIVAANITSLTGSDNCSNVELVFFSNDITPQCGDSEWNDWLYILTDETGNITVTEGMVLINYNDNLPPVISGMNQPDVTISCNEDQPTPPVIGTDVFSNDVCEGDITNTIDYSFTSITGDCNQGQPIEVITHTYTSIDGCGNEATISYSVSIMNDVAPEFDAPYDDGGLVITLVCGVDDVEATIAANVPTAAGCSGPAAITLLSETEGSGPCDQDGGSNPNSNYYLEYQAEDDCGNISIVGLTIDYLDLVPPVLNGIPANVTVGCNDTPPTLPNVTASDVCAGDLTSIIGYEQIDVIGSCDINTNAVIEQHTWTVSDYCGNETSVTWEVYLFNDEQVDLGPDITVCTGEDVFITPSGNWAEYLWEDFSTTSTYLVVEPGTYSVTVTGFGGCCSVDEVTVTYQDFPDIAAVGGTLDCSGDGVTLIGSSSSSNVVYTWIGPGGYSSTEQNPTVTQAGTYTLNVSTTAGCISSADAIVETDTDVPDISTTGATIDCITSEVMISGSSSTPGVTYTWTGPGGFSSTDQSPTVSTPGDYNLVILAPNGCIAEGLAVVEDDTTVPTAIATGGTIDCNNDEITLTGSSSDADADYSWTGPNGYTSIQQNPLASESGSYSLTVSSDNGCTSMTSVAVDEDIATPNLTAEGGTIDCNNSEVVLSASSTTSGVTYQWTGPNGYSSTVANPTVDFAGEYMIVVEAANGCTSSMTVEVNEDITNPEVSVDDEEINCIQSTVTLMPEATDGVSFEWSGPIGFESADENPTVDEAGEYSVVVTADNGCTAMTTLIVTEDIAVPTVTVNDGVIDCNNPMQILDLTTTTEDATFSWNGPHGFTSTEQNPEVDTQGEYTVITTGPNGCTVESILNISQDIDGPNVSASGGEINCDANTVQITGASITADVTYAWVGPNDYSSSAASPDVGSPGTYTLTVTAPNGCTSTATAEVTADENLPNISASGGNLDCNTTEIQLMGSSTSDNVTYSWTGPDGFESTDQNPMIDTEGVYTLAVSSTNGCVSETDVTVTIDNTQPTVIALGGQISCSLDMINLIGNSNDDVTFLWEGPGGFSSDDQNPEVTLPGEYTLTVTSENGCTNSTTVEVTLDDDLPLATLGQPTIDCDDSSITIMVDTDEDYSYEWKFNGEIISLGESVSFSDAGEYSVLVTAANGCAVTLSYTLDQNVEALTADISTTNATSSEGGSAEIMVSNPDAVTNILWDNGQTGASASDLTVGTHTVTVTNILGCTYTFTFEILMSTAVGDIKGLEDYKVYPTIVEDYINIEAELELPQEYTIQINDIQGRLIAKREFKSASVISESISTYSLNDGVYFITLQVGNAVKTSKFVKY